MKIGVVSDSHGRLEITHSAVRLLCERGAELILHCGDIDSPDTVRLFTEIPTHFVLGNWDLRRVLLKRAIQEIGGVIHGELGQLELAGKRLAWLHGHIRGARQRLESSGEFDFVFYGHSHAAEVHQMGRTVVINPGALHRARTKSVALVDLGVGNWMHLRVTEE